MNDASVLAADAAARMLAYTWDDDVVKRAFEDGWPRSFGNVLKLFGGILNRSVTETLQLFDRAGMSKTEMSAAIWRAAEAYYCEKLMTREAQV